MNITTDVTKAQKQAIKLVDHFVMAFALTELYNSEAMRMAAEGFENNIIPFAERGAEMEAAESILALLRQREKEAKEDEGARCISQ